MWQERESSDRGAEATSAMIVVEDDPLVLRAVRQCLERAGYPAPRCASTAAEGLALIAEQPPALVLMDITLAGPLDGVAAAERLRPEQHIALVYLSASADERTLQRAEATAPSGYVLKPFEREQLLCTVRMALARRRSDLEDARRQERLQRGLRALSAQVVNLEADAAPARHRDRGAAGEVDGGAAARLSRLTRREWEVARGLYVEGRVAALASALFLSEHTVRNHLKAIFRKLHISSQQELLALFRAGAALPACAGAGAPP